MYTWHMGSTWYTSDLHLVTIDTYTFVPPWHQGMYPSIEEVMSSVCCQEVTACFMSALFQQKLLASHTLLQGWGSLGMRSGLQEVCQHEARYQLLATDSCNQFLHYWDKSLGTTVGQKISCQCSASGHVTLLLKLPYKNI